MTDAFQILDLKPELVISDETLRDAYHQAGKRLHPDAGGGEGEFAELREAFALLSSPSRRLKHWLERQGIPGELRGMIDPAMMDLFSEVSTITQRAETIIRKREEAKSALIRAMLETETQLCRESVEQAIAQLESAINRECSRFPGLEDDSDREGAWQIARNLSFLEKWRAGLRGCFSRLV